jgi:hypothetical protein
MPVHHLVFFKFKESSCTDAVTAKIHADIPSTLLLIPGVIDAYFGRNFNESRAQGFTHALSVKFENRASFDGWAPHPMHHKWGGDHVDPNLAGPAAECIRKIDIDVPTQQKVAFHIVFFELKESFTTASAKAAVEDLETTLALIPGVTDCAFERYFVKGVGEIPFNYALTVKFDSRSALDGYASHPLHEKWGGKHLDGHITQSQCIDTEMPEHTRRARL